MNGKDLFVGLSYIDERYIHEAETCELPKRQDFPWMRIASMAACLCLVILSLWCIQPLLRGPHGQVPHTTGPDDPFVPEGLLEVVLYVEEMTDDGFTGTVTKLVFPGTFEIGMELNVVITEETGYETADGRTGSIGAQEVDLSGCHVLVECIEYDPDTASIVAGYISEVQPPETTP